MNQTQAQPTWHWRHGGQLSEEKQSKVKQLGNDRGEITLWENCHRCGGTGIFRWWTYHGAAAGECFACYGGRGKWKTYKVYTQEKVEKLEAALIKRREKKEAKRLATEAANLETFRAEHGDVVDQWLKITVPFAENIMTKAVKYGKLSEKQVAALNKVLAREEADRKREQERKEKAARSQHVGSIGERIKVEISILATRDYETMYGWNFWHLLEDAEENLLIYKGSRCLGERGDKVTMKATVKEHSEYQGARQTVLARPKVEKEKIAA